jgi:hypothetical protein
VPTSFEVTAFAGGQESLPSSPALMNSPGCVAEVTVTLDELTISDLRDCEGAECANASEAYGYFAVNDATLNFGGAGSAQFIGLQNGNTYNLRTLLLPFSGSVALTTGLSSADGLSIEFVLFDHDANTPDDLLCSWRENLPPRDAQGWQQQNGRKISRTAAAGEGTCGISVDVTVR